VTVQDAIDVLQKVERKDAPLFFDCPHCGHANTMAEVMEVVLVKTKVEIPDA
jgi:hypothetical protein